MDLTVPAKICWKLPAVGPYCSCHMSSSNCKSYSCQTDWMTPLWGRSLKKIKGSGRVCAITEIFGRVRRLGCHLTRQCLSVYRLFFTSLPESNLYMAVDVFPVLSCWKVVILLFLILVGNSKACWQ